MTKVLCPWATFGVVNECEKHFESRSMKTFQRRLKQLKPFKEKNCHLNVLAKMIRVCIGIVGN